MRILQITKYLTILLLCIGYVNLALAEKPTNKERLITTLMEKSGVNYQLAQFPKQMKFQLGRKFRMAPPPRNCSIQELNSIVENSIEVEDLLKGVENSFKDNLNKNEIKQILKWLDSPLGKKITEYEKSASKPGTTQQMQKIRKQLNNKPKRVKKIKKLNKAAKIDKLLSISVKAQQAFIKGMNSAMPPEKQDSFQNKMQKLVKRHKMQLQAQLNQLALLHSFYAYRKLSDEELNKYIEFAQSDVGKKYQNAGIKGMRKTIIELMHKLGKKTINKIESNSSEQTS